jgi:dipeptidyl aminopeptidase/acylaminoacyl peptidase
VSPCRRRSSRFVTNLRFFKGTRRVACASTAATGSCGFCCTDSGPVGGDVCGWFSPTRSSVGTAELSPGIGPGNRAAFPEARDEQWIAYVSFPEGSLWHAKSDGTQRQQLTWPPFSVLNPSWSPDGKDIAFSALLPGRTWKTFIIQAQGGTARELTQTDCAERTRTGPRTAHISPLVLFPFSRTAQLAE